MIRSDNHPSSVSFNCTTPGPTKTGSQSLYVNITSKLEESDKISQIFSVNITVAVGVILTQGRVEGEVEKKVFRAYSLIL